MGKKIVALLTILAIIFTVAICTPDSNAGIQTLNLSKQTKEIKVGESFQLTMTGVKASSIKWKSSKPGVATVSKKGVVKGVKAGTTNITGKYKNLKFTIKVTVTGSSSPKTPEKNTETPSASSTDVLLGSKANVEIYYVKVKENKKTISKIELHREKVIDEERPFFEKEIFNSIFCTGEKKIITNSFELRYALLLEDLEFH